MAQLSTVTELHTISTDNASSPIKDSDQISRTGDPPHRFRVHYLACQKELELRAYLSVEEITKEVFRVYDKAEFNDGNALLSYLNENADEVPLQEVPKPLEKNQYMDLFIRHVSAPCTPEIESFQHRVVDPRSVQYVCQFIRYSGGSTTFRMSEQDLWRTVLLQLCLRHPEQLPRVFIHLYQLPQKHLSEKERLHRATDDLAEYRPSLRH